MSRILKRIEKSRWSLTAVKYAALITGEQLNLHWLEHFDEVIASREAYEKNFLLECILEHLFKSGPTLLSQIEANLTYQEARLKIAEMEENSAGFAREMSFLRRKIARELMDRGEKLSGPAQLNASLSYIFDLLEGKQCLSHKTID